MATVLGASAPPEGARRRVAPPQHPLSEPEAGGPRQVRLDRSRKSRFFRGWRSQAGLPRVQRHLRCGGGRRRLEGGVVGAESVLRWSTRPAYSRARVSSVVCQRRRCGNCHRGPQPRRRAHSRGRPPLAGATGPQTEAMIRDAAAHHLRVPSHWYAWTCGRSLVLN